jgi:hypothetical protein
MKKENTIRKIFDVIINNKVYSTYSIDGKEHNGYNDTPKTWWIYYSDDPKIPSIDNKQWIPSIDDKNWVPYSCGILRRLWEFKIKQKNSTKYKYDELRFNNHTSVEMYCNNKLIYEFGTSGNALDFVLAKIQYLQVVLSEHPYNFFEPEKENGRKICYYGLPAIVLNGYHVGEIKIKPDYTAGLSKDEWWKEYKNRKSVISNKDDMDKQFDEMDDESMEEYYHDDEINYGDALSDGNIYWFRK